MDVTNGLLSNLVETKSIQRVLSPIASLVSQLIIDTECEGEQKVNIISVTGNDGEEVALQGAVNRLIHSVTAVTDGLVMSSAAEQLLDKDELRQSCDQLREAADSLSLACTRVISHGSSRVQGSSRVDVSRSLVLTAKHLLQATMKVLLVVDACEVSAVRFAVHRVKERLGLLLAVQQLTHIAPAFKAFIDSVTHLAATSHHRQSDMISDHRRDTIVTCLVSLKKSVPLLIASVQNCVKYPSNTHALATREFAVKEIRTCIDDILDAVTNCMCEGRDGESGTFLMTLDKILESTSEENRDIHTPDMETWIDSVVQHAMCVAHLCTNAHRDLIVKNCHRILHQKTRVFELSCLRQENLEMMELRCDYDEACEILTDEFCDLERGVNMALLSLIVGVMYQRSRPFDRVVEVATATNQVCAVAELQTAIDSFCQYSDSVCQIARLASCSANNHTRIQMMRACIQRLEQLDPEVTPAALSCIQKQDDACARQHLQLLRQEWAMEFGEMVKVIDDMVDPRVFLQLSEQLLRDETDQCVDFVTSHDLHAMYSLQPSITGKTERVIQISKHIADTHNDPVFRNGLQVHVSRLSKTLSSLCDSCHLLTSNPTNVVVMDTICRRLRLIVEGVNHIRNSLHGNDSLHLMSPLRQKVRNKRSADSVIEKNGQSLTQNTQPIDSTQPVTFSAKRDASNTYSGNNDSNNGHTNNGNRNNGHSNDSHSNNGYRNNGHTNNQTDGVYLKLNDSIADLNFTSNEATNNFDSLADLSSSGFTPIDAGDIFDSEPDDLYDSVNNITNINNTTDINITDLNIGHCITDSKTRALKKNFENIQINADKHHENDKRASRLSPLNPENDKQASRLSPLHHQNDKLARGSSPLNPDNDKQASRLSPLHHKNGELASRLSPLNPDNDKQASRLSPLHHKNGELASRLSPLNPENDKQACRLSPVHHQNDKLARGSSPLNPDNDKQASRLSPLHHKNGELASRLSPLNPENDKQASRLSPLHHENDKQASRLSPLDHKKTDHDDVSDDERDESWREFYSANEGDETTGCDNHAYSHDSPQKSHNESVSTDSFFSQPTYNSVHIRDGSGQLSPVQIDPVQIQDGGQRTPQASPSGTVKATRVYISPPRTTVTISREAIQRDNAVARLMCDIHRITDDIAGIWDHKAPVTPQTNSMMLAAVQELSLYAGTFTSYLCSLADAVTQKPCKELSSHIDLVTTATTQLDVMSKLLHSPPSNVLTYGAVVRTSKRLLSTVCQAINAVDAVCLQSFAHDGDTKSHNAMVTSFLQLIDWKRERVKRLEDNQSHDTLDELGLRRIEMDERFSLTDVLFHKR